MVDLLKDLWRFMAQRKKFWLIPILFVLLIVGVLTILAEFSSVAPFIYTVF
jgi:competence protein ComGC